MADEKLYLMDCNNALSSWKAYQHKLFNEARRFDHQLFTRAQIVALGHHLDKVGRSCRSYIPGSVILPDWDFCASYGVNPSIQLGPGCSIKFIRVAGVFTGK